MDAPADFTRALEENERQLAALAAELGGTVAPIDPAERATWLQGDVEWAPLRILEAARGDLRLYVIANQVRVSGASSARGATSWRAEHLVAVRRADADVPGPLHVLDLRLPVVGSLVRMPHLAAGQRPEGSPEVWTLDDAGPPCDPAPFRFTACVNGILYAHLGRTDLAAGDARSALAALESAARLPWRAPTPEEKAARRAASTGRAQALAAGCCLVLLLALVGLVAAFARGVS